MTARSTVPRLGRGLDALLATMTPADAVPSSASRDLPIEHLSPGPFQPRAHLEPDTLTELAQSIRTQGVLQPLLARPDPQQPGLYQIVAGERRWRAAQMVGLTTVPVFIRPLNDSEALAAALIENLQRVDLNAVEEAEGLRRLSDEFGLTHEALAAAIGKSRSHVSNMMRLLRLPDSVLTEVRRGALSAGHARALITHPDPARAALQIIAGDLSVRATEALALTPQRPLSPPLEKDANTEALNEMLCHALGLKVSVQQTGQRGTVRIRFETLDQLDGLTRLLLGAS